MLLRILKTLFFECITVGFQLGQMVIVASTLSSACAATATCAVSSNTRNLPPPSRTGVLFYSFWISILTKKEKTNRILDKNVLCDGATTHQRRHLHLLTHLLHSQWHGTPRCNDRRQHRSHCHRRSTPYTQTKRQTHENWFETMISNLPRQHQRHVDVFHRVVLHAPHKHRTWHTRLFVIVWYHCRYLNQQQQQQQHYHHHHHHHHHYYHHRIHNILVATRRVGLRHPTHQGMWSTHAATMPSIATVARLSVYFELLNYS